MHPLPLRRPPRRVAQRASTRTIATAAQLAGTVVLVALVVTPAHALLGLVGGLLPRPTPGLPAVCRSAIHLPPLATVPFTIKPGAAQCGGAALNSPAPAPPFSGSVDATTGAPIADLSLGCLYTGGFPGLMLPDGATAMLDVTGVNALPLSLTLSGSAGTGPRDCTRGAGPLHACANGAGGTDGAGHCASDADCGDSVPAGVCALEPNCYFGPPIPVPNGILSACVLNAFEHDLCGRVDLAPPSAVFATSLSARVYFTGDAASPCPRCEAGVCTGGDRVGEPCTPVGSAATSIDCPPASDRFLAALPVAISTLTTGTSTLTAGSDGRFCSGQVLPGAFGIPAARRISETGTPPLSSGNLLEVDLAATFCVGSTGTLLDAIAQLPGAGALSAAGQIDVGGLLGGVLPLH